jgi:RNA polymerase sigma-70 factor, ECF subfamily
LVWGFPTLRGRNVSGANGIGRSGSPLSSRAQTSAPPPVGNDAAEVDIGSLYRTYATKVGRWAARLGGPAIEVDDVVQEVFLVANRRLRRFRPDGGTATTWLFRTTERIVKAARRKQRVRRMFTWPPSASPPGAGVARAIPSDEFERRQEIERVYRVLDCLPERQRRVLILFELEGLSTAEIATLVGARVGTVRVWLFRARAEFLRRHDQLTAAVPKERGPA